MGVEVKVPTLGESVTEATVAKWFKAAGDAVARDEALLELETDKVTVEVNAPVAGALKSISAQEGAEVQVGALLGIIEEGAAGAAAPAPKAEKPAAQPEMKAAVSAYNADGVNKTAYRVDNPDANALLYAGGYVRTLDTPDAVEAYKSYSKGEPEINFTVGFRQEGFVSYANLGGGPLGDQVRTYQSLPSGEGEYERPDYLRAHPDLNVLLWQTGHTSKVYSLAAWNKVASK